MTERELFVICSNCGAENSPYVTECPYCGQRLRKRAPDLKKEQRKRKQRRAAQERKARAFRSAFEPRLPRRLGGRSGGGGEASKAASYLSESRFPPGIAALIVISIIASLALRVNGFPRADLWLAPHIEAGALAFGGIGSDWWKLVTSPFFHDGLGYGFVSLFVAALFGGGLERRFGLLVPVTVWLVCGAAGVMLESLIGPVPFSNGAGGIAAGMIVSWIIVVAGSEDLRDYDAAGLAAIGALVLALPLATDEASIWSTVGGVIAGAACGGLLLARLRRG